MFYEFAVIESFSRQAFKARTVRRTSTIVRAICVRTGARASMASTLIAAVVRPISRANIARLTSMNAPQGKI